MARTQTRACEFCGKPFTANGNARFCSKKCSDRAWTAKRSEKRRAARRAATRLCEFCGKPFEWNSDHGNKRFCSNKCKKAAESATRSASGSRKDIVGIKAASAPPPSLDELRKEKGVRYFRALFKLPEAEQFAEMTTWDEVDHEAAMQYLDVAVDGQDSGVSEISITIKFREPAVFDEEDHFGS